MATPDAYMVQGVWNLYLLKVLVHILDVVTLTPRHGSISMVALADSFRMSY
jgi:hypothetical protein